MCVDKTFEDFSQIEEFFKEQKDTDVWLELPVKDIRILQVPNAPIAVGALPVMEDPLDEIRIKAAKNDDIIKAMSGTGMLVSFYNGTTLETIPLRDCAMISLLARAGISGPAMKELQAEKKVKILNWCLELWDKKQGIVLKRDGEIFAIHSSSYCILPQYDLVACLRKKLESMGANHICEAETIDVLTVIRSRIDDKKLIKKAVDTLERIGNHTLKMAQPELVFTTSDTASAGANLYPYAVTSEGVRIRIGAALLLPHDSGNTLDKFNDNLEMLYKIFDDSSKLLERMAGQDIFYAEDCIRNAAAKAGIGTKTVEMYIEESFVPGIRYTAYDVYFALWEMVAALNKDPLSRLEKEEAVARLLNIDFSVFDVPLAV